MTEPLSVQLKTLLKPQLCFDKKTFNDFKKRISEGYLTRDENPISHFGIFILPYCPKTKKVFLIHHKKSNLWIFPGGHVDKEEDLYQTASREAKEELGIEMSKFSPPFLFSIVKTKNLSYSCRLHFDVWILIKLNEGDIELDNREFLQGSWMTLNKAAEKTKDPATIEALRRLRKNVSSETYSIMELAGGLKEKAFKGKHVSRIIKAEEQAAGKTVAKKYKKKILKLAKQSF